MLSTRSVDDVEFSARTEKIANVLNQANADLLDDSDDGERPKLKKKAGRPDMELDSTSDEDEPMRPKVLRKGPTSMESDYSSDDEPLVKPKSA